MKKLLRSITGSIVFYDVMASLLIASAITAFYLLAALIFPGLPVSYALVILLFMAVGTFVLIAFFQGAFGSKR